MTFQVVSGSAGRRFTTSILGFALAAVLTGCGLVGDAGPQSKAIGAGVRATGTDLPDLKAARETAPVVVPIVRRQTQAGTSFQVTPSGPLGNPVTLTFPVPAPPPAGHDLVMVTSETRRGPWTALPTTYNPKTGTAAVSVRHLSWFTQLVVDVRALGQALKKEIIDGLSGNLVAEAEKPSCHDSATVRDGYEVDSRGDAALWCVGMQAGQPVVKLVNHRRYPLLVHYPADPPLSNDSRKTELATWSRIFAGRQTAAISPRRTLVFALHGDKGTFASESDVQGMNLFAAQTGAEALWAILTKFGGADLKGRAKAVDAMLSAVKCASTLGQTGGDIIAGCFSPAAIMRAFGLKGLLLAPFVATGGLMNYFRAAFNALGDVWNGRDKFAFAYAQSGPSPVPAGTTSSAPPTTAAAAPLGGGSFDIGAPFSAACVVAWPTAPTRTSRSILMRMSCSGVPAQFLFVDVEYGDPNLPITPSTGRVRVTGHVVDIAKSEYGFTTIQVLADDVQLP